MFHYFEIDHFTTLLNGECWEVDEQTFVGREDLEVLNERSCNNYIGQS